MWGTMEGDTNTCINTNVYLCIQIVDRRIDIKVWSYGSSRLCKSTIVDTISVLLTEGIWLQIKNFNLTH